MIKHLKIIIVLLVLLLSASAYAEDKSNWQFYFFGVNINAIKEMNWKEVTLGAVSTIVVHIAGHHIDGLIYGDAVEQRGTHEYFKEPQSKERTVEFVRAGFILEHAVGLALTSFEKTRNTDFTKGYVAAAWVHTVTYPIVEGADLKTSENNGGSYYGDYAVYVLAATHNLLRVNLKEK